MKKIIGWTLEISKGYRSIKFHFETGVEAQQFLIAWLNHKAEVDRYDKNEDEYSIYPVFEQEEESDPDEVEDDIPETEKSAVMPET